MSAAVTHAQRRLFRRRRIIQPPGALAIKQRLQLSLFVLLILLLAVLLTGMVATYNLYRSAEDHYIGVALPLRSAARDVLFQMEREETGVRGYMITSNRRSLQPYFAGRPRVFEDLRQIASLSKDHPEIAGRVQEVRKEVV